MPAALIIRLNFDAPALTSKGAWHDKLQIPTRACSSGDFLCVAVNVLGDAYALAYLKFAGL